MTLELEIKNREVFGKKVGALRKDGFVPAEIYGHGAENMHVSVDEKAFMKLYRIAGENTIITLKNGGEKIPALISEVSFDHVADKPLSIDFHKVRKDEKIKAYIPIVLTGKNVAKENGFDLIHTLQECEVEALPDSLPHEFLVDTTTLSEVGQSITVADLKLEKNVKALTPHDTVIVAVTEKQKEIVEEKPPEPAEAAPAEEVKETKKSE